MKKICMTLAFVLAVVLSLTMITACADQSGTSAVPESTAAPAATVIVPTPPAQSSAAVTVIPTATPEAAPAAVPAAAPETAAPAEEAKEVDAVVGSFKYPAPPYDCDFDKYIVLKEDGSFMYVTNLYDSGRGGSYTQTIQTNEDFYWLKTGGNSYELHEDYHDINGEFVSQFTYNEEEDALYMFGMLYATRDSSLVIK